MKKNTINTSRRNFLKSSFTLPVALATIPSMIMAQDDAKPADASATPAPAPTLLPTRTLGKSGRQVTMLNLGGMMAALSPQYLDIAWSMGIRYFDTADCYLHGNSEKIIAKWLAKYPERRKEIFLVSKDHPHKGPHEMLEMIDRRLEACGTTYLDAFYIHGLGPNEYSEDSVNWPKSDEFRKTADQLRTSGKVKMVGFSCHDGRLNEYLTSAADGGFLDIIMLRYTPFFKKGDAFDTALDACHAKGIALVAMKTMRNTGDIPKQLPEFEKMGLTTHQAVLQACWSDPRISSICNMIDNVTQMESSTTAAKNYKTPLTTAQIEVLRGAVVAARPTMCPSCPSCDAFAATSSFALHDISRFVTYYEQDGNVEARNYYQKLSATARDASGVDLAALRDKCSFHVDYPTIIKRAGQYFA
jgi:predicted aldo/keto reductase-like oxidoreductase